MWNEYAYPNTILIDKAHKQGQAHDTEHEQKLSLRKYLRLIVKSGLCGLDSARHLEPGR